MAERAPKAAEQALMRQMNITEQTVARRRRLVGLDRDDEARIAQARESVRERVDELVETFFAFVSELDEARSVLGDRELRERARRLKREHLLAMVSGPYDLAYVEQRVTLGLLYARVRLDSQLFLGAFHHLIEHLGRLVMDQFEREPRRAGEVLGALHKVAFFDLGIVMDVLAYERERVIVQQQEAIRELSTPVLQVRDRMLLLPLIGVIDTHRAQLVTEGLLHAIRTSRARVAVMDVTGVATVDSKVANHLLQTVAAARLMGAHVIVTGLSPDVAQSLVALGLEVGRFDTMGDLQGGLEAAERMLGYKVTPMGEHVEGGR